MIDVVGGVNDYMARQRKQYPCHTNRASELGHPCIRYLYYLRTQWEKKELHEVGLQYIFEEGNMHHDAVRNLLRKAGFIVTEEERPLELKQYQITGHMDGRIGDGSEFCPMEIKGLNQFSWEKINSIEDMASSNKVWLRKYPVQMNIYLGMDNSDQGVFILKNKQTGQLKQIIQDFDTKEFDVLCKKAELINQHIDNGTLPGPIEPDEDICGRCGFTMLCMPDRKFGEALKVVNDDLLLEWLEEREELREIEKRYKELDRNVKNAVSGQGNLLVGDFHITGKAVKRGGYTVKPCEYWLAKILRLKAKGTKWNL